MVVVPHGYHCCREIITMQLQLENFMAVAGLLLLMC